MTQHGPDPHLLPVEPEADAVPHTASEARRALQSAMWECKRVVVGQDAMLERVLVARPSAERPALALLRGRGHVTAADVHDLAKDVLRHRISLSYDALADGVDPDELLDVVLDAVAPEGRQPLTEAA